jgi:uncharacterized protein YndB with AHSA1/START domain
MILAIAYEFTYPYRPDVVWRALTDPAALRAWLTDHDLLVARAGERFRFTDRPRPLGHGIWECEFAEVDAPHRLVLRWGVDRKAASTVSFMLEPTDAGATRLTFRHAGFRGPAGLWARYATTPPWDLILDRALPVALDAVAAGRIPSREDARLAMIGK